RVHAVLERRFAEGRLTPEIIADRVRRIGPAAFAEIRLVLAQERCLLPPADEPRIYEEFAALYLELRAFAPQLVPVYFPSLDDVPAIDALLAEDVDAPELLAETGPAGAGDAADSATERATEQPAVSQATPSAEECRRLAVRAERAERKGNVVRAA